MNELLRWVVAPLGLGVTGYCVAQAPMPYLAVGIAALCVAVIALVASYQISGGSSWKRPE